MFLPGGVIGQTRVWNDEGDTRLKLPRPNTLFDNAPEHIPTTAPAPASLFSDNNPFRRKPQQYASISESPKFTQILNSGVSKNHDSIDEKKRKRNKEEKTPTATADPDSLIEVSEKKKKKQASDERQQRF
ncbi:unnamed protein product [Lupinus luteus]|uniref:Uncharacterized protein n=1 Tax=Lupinus luteus TaxID=3873 RepID=A0AAV1W2D2_LUPLU